MNWQLLFVVLGLVLAIVATVLAVLNYEGQELSAALVFGVIAIFCILFPSKSNQQ